MKIFKNIILIITLLVILPIRLNYVNASDDTHTHEFDNGICACGTFKEPEWDQGVHSGYLVSNAGELIWYQQNYNNGNIISDIKIDNDITLPEGTKWVPIGTLEHPFKDNLKTFENEMYTINLGVQNVTTSNFGLIGYTASDGINTTFIENIQISGTFNISGTVECVGGVLGQGTKETTVRNVINDVDINIFEGGTGSVKIGGLVGAGLDQTSIELSMNYGTLSLDGAYEAIGGICGYLEDGIISYTANYGEVLSSTAKYIGGILGYASSESFKGINNSINKATIVGNTFNISINGSTAPVKPSDICSYANTQSMDIFVNNYYTGINPLGFIDETTGFTLVNTDELTSGKIAYLLGNPFGQILDNLETDERKELYPVIGSLSVYEVYECDGVTIKYSNFNENTEHEYTYHEDGNKIIQTCIECGEIKTLEIKEPNNPHYDKTPKEVVLVTDIEGLDVDSINVTYNAEPIFPGTYTATITYLDLTATLEFNVLKGVPTSTMFEFIEPGTLVYDGNPKYLDLVKTEEPGMGEIVVKYQYGQNTLDNPQDAGLYTVKLSVLEGQYYEAHEFSILDLFLNITIEKKEVTITWTETTLFYEEGVNTYIPKFMVHGTIDNYKPIFNFSYSASGVGTYSTTLSLYDNNYTLVGDNLTTSFTVKPILVEAPIIENVLMIEGVQQVPTIEENPLYRVVQNNGGTYFGKYPVILELIDDDAYTWETTDDAELTLFFIIYMSDSKWIQYPTIEDWTYGESPKLPVLEVSNGYLGYTYKYRPVGGEFSNIVPTEVGEYEVKIEFEKDDARCVPLEDVILPFSINKKDPICGIDSILYADYGTRLEDIELVGFGEGTWSYIDDEDVILNAGTYQVDVLFTPLTPRIYNEVTKTITVVINKLETIYQEPEKLDNLVYNGNYQLVIDAGSVINGEMYYKVDDGTWQTSLPLLKDAGTYTVYYKVDGDINHTDVLEKSIHVEILKADLQIIAENKEIEQYTEIPALTYTITGLLSGDNLEQNPTIQVTLENTNTVGDYEIEIFGAESSNYNITYTNATLKIYEHKNCVGGTATCKNLAICDICSKEYGKTLDHEFEVYQFNFDATCTSLGSETAKCTNCDETDKKNRIEGELLPHSFDEYTKDCTASCIKDETLRSVCTCCGIVDVITVENSKTDHQDENLDNVCDICSVSMNMQEEVKNDSLLGLGIVIGSVPLLIVSTVLYFIVIKPKQRKIQKNSKKEEE